MARLLPFFPGEEMMKQKFMIVLFFILPVFAINCVLDLSSVSGETTRKGAMIGEQLSGTINVWGAGASEYGDEEVYDVKITILEVLRGEEAWTRLQAVDSSNVRPRDGLEYILAHIRFEYFAKTSPGNKSYTIKQDDFKVYSEENRAYEPPKVSSPQPELIGKRFRSGDSHEGWITFLTATDNEKPFVFFIGGMWFQLFGS